MKCDRDDCQLTCSLSPMNSEESVVTVACGVCGSSESHRMETADAADFQYQFAPSVPNPFKPPEVQEETE